MLKRFVFSVLAVLGVMASAAQSAETQTLPPLPRFPVLICQHRSAGVQILPEMREHATLIDAILPMWMEALDSGDVRALKGCEGPFENYVSGAHRLGVRVMPIVRNFAPQKLLASPQALARCADQVATLAAREGFDGVLVDMEELQPADREPLVELVRQIRVHAAFAGRTLGVAVPRNSPRNEVDYAGLANHCDFLFAMFYDYVGPWNKILGPSAPLAWPDHNSDIARDLAGVLKTGLRRDRLLFGLPVYGNDFTLDDAGKVTQVKALYLDHAEQLRQRNNATVQWDSVTRAPRFDYVGSDGKPHQVWFEDERSLKEKIDLAQREGLRGIGVWSILYADRPVGGGFWKVIAESRQKTKSDR